VVIRTVINNMTFDGATKDPIQQAVRDALIGFMAATAEVQTEATRVAQRGGIELAKETGIYRGRKPSFTRGQLHAVKEMLSTDANVSTIAPATGLTRQTIYRIKQDAVAAEAMLARWEREAGEVEECVLEVVPTRPCLGVWVLSLRC
jgi:putative DNA-invertase from lambdoid prophage Rac